MLTLREDQCLVRDHLWDMEKGRSNEVRFSVRTLGGMYAELPSIRNDSYRCPGIPHAGGIFDSGALARCGCLGDFSDFVHGLHLLNVDVSRPSAYVNYQPQTSFSTRTPPPLPKQLPVIVSPTSLTIPPT